LSYHIISYHIISYHLLLNSIKNTKQQCLWSCHRGTATVQEFTRFVYRQPIDQGSLKPHIHQLISVSYFCEVY